MIAFMHFYINYNPFHRLWIDNILYIFSSYIWIIFQVNIKLIFFSVNGSFLKLPFFYIKNDKKLEYDPVNTFQKFNHECIQEVLYKVKVGILEKHMACSHSNLIIKLKVKW